MTHSVRRDGDYYRDARGIARLRQFATRSVHPKRVAVAASCNVLILLALQPQAHINLDIGRLLRLLAGKVAQEKPAPWRVARYSKPAEVLWQLVAALKADAERGQAHPHHPLILRICELTNAMLLEPELEQRFEGEP